MRKRILLVLFASCLFLAACKAKTTTTNEKSTTRNKTSITTKKNYTGDNINTPFIELDNANQAKFEDAFFSKSIYISNDYYKDCYSLEERNNKTAGWQENRNKDNEKDYHFWFTCYYMKDATLIIHVERSDKDVTTHKWAYFDKGYELGDYSFYVSGNCLEHYTYILVYKDDNLYEFDYAYNNGIVDDDVVKSAYKYYIDSKFIKFDPYYNPYKKTTKQKTTEE